MGHRVSRDLHGKHECDGSKFPLVVLLNAPFIIISKYANVTQLDHFQLRKNSGETYLEFAGGRSLTRAPKESDDAPRTLVRLGGNSFRSRRSTPSWTKTYPNLHRESALVQTQMKADSMSQETRDDCSCSLNGASEEFNWIPNLLSAAFDRRVRGRSHRHAYGAWLNGESESTH